MIDLTGHDAMVVSDSRVAAIGACSVSNLKAVRRPRAVSTVVPSSSFSATS